MQSLRCSQRTLITRRAQHPLLGYTRLQSTSSVSDPPLESVVRKVVRGTSISPEGRKGTKAKGKKRFGQLAQFGDNEGPPHPRAVHWDLRRLSGELSTLRQTQLNLARTIKGPYGVRTIDAGPPINTGQQISFENNEVTVRETAIPNVWLRDNCQCSSCVHESTKQRLQDTFAIPKDLSIKAASFSKGKDGTKTYISIEWSDGHKSTYTQPFLINAIADPAKKSTIRQGWITPYLWTSAIAQDEAHLPTIPYTEAVGRNMQTVLRLLRKYGFCYIDETPHEDPKATEELLRHIAFIRETHYGAFYDFTADLASQDTAYTNIALEAHTDNTYFSDPAGLQAFHLLSHTDGSGGASLLVDGFKVADELQRSDPAAYRVLSTVNVHAHASGNEGISIQPYRGFPVLEHDPATGDLLRVRWNSADRAGIELPISEVEVWYDAARKFDALLKKKENEYWEQLVPGRVLVFDNWRVLHGRSSFTGKRRICGGYINRDDWISRAKMVLYGSERVMGALAGS